MYRYSMLIPVAVVLLFLACPGAAETAGGRQPKIIVMEFHGLKKDILADNLDRLPHFKELIQGPGNQRPYVHLSKVFTTIPAASVPACTSMYTGRSPRHTGVVSTIWFDRGTMEVYTMISYLQQRINRKLKQNKIKTIFDYAADAGKRSMSAMLMIDKGTDYSIKTGMFFWGNASAVGFLKHGHWFPDPWYMDYKTVSGFLTGHVFAYANSLSGILEKEASLPDLMVVQLLGMDIYSHYPDADLVAKQASMDEIQTRYTIQVLDPLIGRITGFLKSKNRFDDTVFFLVSQQGSVKIEKHIPDGILNDILQGNYRLPGNDTGNREADAVVMLGACTKEIYLKNRQTEKWLDPPRLLADVKPAVDLIIENATIQESLNEMVVRQYPAERHEGVDEKNLWWGFDWRAYLKSAKQASDFFAALLPLDETAGRFELGRYIQKGLIEQYTRDTAPDIKLINKKGFYFERDFDKYGHHGSYYADDLIVSFWIAGPGLTHIIPGRHTIDQPASTLDLVPMVASLLQMEVPDTLDGTNPLTGLMNGRSERPYTGCQIFVPK